MKLSAKRADTYSERYRNRQGLICIQFAKVRGTKLRKTRNAQRVDGADADIANVQLYVESHDISELPSH